jgi:hypothetical protein
LYNKWVPVEKEQILNNWAIAGKGGFCLEFVGLSSNLIPKPAPTLDLLG